MMIAFAPGYAAEPVDSDQDATELVEEITSLRVAIDLLAETLDVLDEKFSSNG